MPFNSELESFAQAFSQGYSATDSAEERRLKKAQATAAEYEVTPEALDRRRRGEEADIGYKTESTSSLAYENSQPQRDLKRRTEELNQANLAADVARKNWEDNPTNRQLTQEKDRALIAANKAQTAVNEQAAIAGAYENSPPQREQKNRVTEAGIRSTDATTAVNEQAAAAGAYENAPPQREQKRRAAEADISGKEALTAGTLVETDTKEIANRKAKRDDAIQQLIFDNITSKSKRAKPAVNQPHAVTPEGETAVPEEPAAAGTTGPAPFVLRKPPPPAVGPTAAPTAAPVGPVIRPQASAVPTEAGTVNVASAEEVPQVDIGTHDPVGAEAVPTTGPTAAVPATLTSAGNVSAPAPGTSTTAPTTANPRRQQVIDHAINGDGSTTLPTGEKVLDVAGKEAVKDGLDLLIKHHGLDQDNAVATPEIDGQHLGYLTGARAASPDAVKMVEDTVEEQAGEELSQNEKTYYGLATGWLYNNAIGDPVAAQKYAASMLSHYQMVFGQYTAVMQAAVQNGDMDAAAELAVKAYANVPTGDELKITKSKDGKHYIATTTDMNGKVTEKQLMTPEEMGAFAMEMDPSSFVKFISQAAGKESKAISPAAADELSKQLGIPADKLALMEPDEISRIQEGQKALRDAGKPLTFEERTKVTEDISNAFTEFGKAQPNAMAELDLENPQGMREDLQHVAETIYGYHGNNMSPATAVKTTVALLSKYPTNFKTLPDGKTFEVKMPGSEAFKIDRGAWTTIAVLREERERAAKAAETDKLRGSAGLSLAAQSLARSRHLPASEAAAVPVGIEPSLSPTYDPRTPAEAAAGLP